MFKNHASACLHGWTVEGPVYQILMQAHVTAGFIRKASLSNGVNMATLQHCFIDLFRHEEMTRAHFHWLFMSRISRHRFHLIDLTVLGK